MAQRGLVALLDPVITRPTWTAVVFEHAGMGEAMKGLFENYWRRKMVTSACSPELSRLNRRHYERSRCIGSMRVVLKAGTTHASNPTLRTNAAADNITTGSFGATPNNKC